MLYILSEVLPVSQNFTDKCQDTDNAIMSSSCFAVILLEQKDFVYATEQCLHLQIRIIDSLMIFK